MLIINADNWGRSAVETDAVLTCYQEGRITSVSAMMFMGIPSALLGWQKKTNWMLAMPDVS